MRLVGQLIGLFSFDVGYEIDLPRARALAGEAEPAEMRAAAPRRRTWPTRRRPSRSPLGTPVVTVGDETVTADGERARPRVRRGHGPAAVAARPRARRAAGAHQHPHGRRAARGRGPRCSWRSSSSASCRRSSKPGLNRFVEDYYVLQVDRFEPPTTIPELLAREQSHASPPRCAARRACSRTPRPPTSSARSSRTTRTTWWSPSGTWRWSWTTSTTPTP